MIIERISIELTNQCQKGCWFCYNHSQPTGETQWQVDELVEFVSDCKHNGTKAVSFGGGEPLQYDGVFELLRRLEGMLFRSLTTNGLLLERVFERLIEARPDKLHVSIHFPENESEVSRVSEQVIRLNLAGLRCGVNLLVARSKLKEAKRVTQRLHAEGIDNDRIVFLPMRGSDTPSPQEVASVAGNKPFQSMTCLADCRRSPRFCSVGWDKSVAWCSYTTARRTLDDLSHAALTRSLTELPLVFCGGRDD